MPTATTSSRGSAAIVLEGLLDSVPDPIIAAPGSSSKEALEHHLRAAAAVGRLHRRDGTLLTPPSLYVRRVVGRWVTQLATQVRSPEPEDPSKLLPNVDSIFGVQPETVAGSGACSPGV